MTKILVLYYSRNGHIDGNVTGIFKNVGANAR